MHASTTIMPDGQRVELELSALPKRLGTNLSDTIREPSTEVTQAFPDRFRDGQRMHIFCSMFAPPDELFRLRRQPAQSLSVNTSMVSVSSCMSYRHTNLFAFFK